MTCLCQVQSFLASSSKAFGRLRIKLPGSLPPAEVQPLLPPLPELLGRLSGGHVSASLVARSFRDDDEEEEEDLVEEEGEDEEEDEEDDLQEEEEEEENEWDDVEEEQEEEENEEEED